MSEIYPECLEDKTKCHWNGSEGFCCSGNCVQDASEPLGECEERVIEPPTTTPSTVITSDSTVPTVIQDESKLLPIIIPIVVLVILVITYGFIWFQCRRIRKRKILASLFHHDFSMYSLENIANLPYDKQWEIPESHFSVDLDTQLGSGCFGTVFLGKVKGQDVAVKTVRSKNIEGDQIRSLILEIKVLQYINTFENIVSMIGCNTSKLASGKAYIFLEYCPLGSLESYLRKNRHKFMWDDTQVSDSEEENLCGYETDMTMTSGDDKNTHEASKKISIQDLILWSLQLTNAMKFLVIKKVIHADISTRNVLLLRKDCAKLTDFGLARRLHEYSSYVKKHQEPLPWRWMAIESLQELSFSYQSDVWSMGITFWEIFSLGEMPYAGLSWTPEFVNLLQQNLRPAKPTYASNEIYDIMHDCWKLNPESRPTPEEIYQKLDEYHKKLL